jgi:glycosyltransferase involved in cell wall biosynthesis
MNILFVIEQLNVGGAQTFLVRLATQFPKDKHCIYVWEIKPSERNEANYKKLIDNNITVITSPFALWNIYMEKHQWKFVKKISYKLNVWFNIGFIIDLWKLKHFIRSKKINIVNSHLYQADNYSCRLLNKIPIKIVSTFHGCYNLYQTEIANNEANLLFANTFKQNLNIIFKRLNGVIYLTDRQLELPGYINIAVIPKQKIYNGFLSSPPKKDSNTLSKTQKDNWKFGMIARGEKSKGWEEAIQAFLYLKKQNPSKSLSLNLIGESFFLDSLKNEYKDSDVFFHGQIADPLSLISQWDVGLLPTYFAAESLPNTIIEYMYSQIPTIATGVA